MTRPSSSVAFASLFAPTLARSSSARALRSRRFATPVIVSASLLNRSANGRAAAADAAVTAPLQSHSRRGFLAAALGATATVAAVGLASPAYAEAPMKPGKPVPSPVEVEAVEAASAAAAETTAELASTAAEIAASGVAQAVTTAKASGADPEAGIELSTDGEVDPFRDTLLRYLGYANECGESFRPFIGHNGVIATYLIASGYVVADSIYQSKKVGDQEVANDTAPTLRNAKMAAAGFDSLLWQSLASVAIPGYTINRVVHFSELALDKASAKGALRRWLPTLIGLGTIPFIIHPIDNLVHKLLDTTTRPVANKLVTSLESGKDDTVA